MNCRAGLGGSLLGLPNLLQLLSALRAFAYGTPGAFHLIALTILIVVASLLTSSPAWVSSQVSVLHRVFCVFITGAFVAVGLAGIGAGDSG